VLRRVPVRQRMHSGPVLRFDVSTLGSLICAIGVRESRFRWPLCTAEAWLFL
jgi:hypothetical protein